MSKITKLIPEEGGSTASETLVSNHLTTWSNNNNNNNNNNNPENHEFCFSAVKPRIMLLMDKFYIHYARSINYRFKTQIWCTDIPYVF
jgi:hypothetical protein